MAADLLVENRKFEVTEKARVALEKNGIWIPLAYSEAIHDPIYRSEWKGAIHILNSPDGFGAGIEPGQVHLGAAKHVLHYLKGIICYGLDFGAKGSQQRYGLIAYSDSAYAN